MSSRPLEISSWMEAVKPVPWKSANPELVRTYRLVMPNGKGTLKSLIWKACERPRPGVGEVEIRVIAAALNFRDVLSVLGRYPGSTIALGAECSGVVVSVGHEAGSFRIGDEVLAVAPGCFSSYVLADHRVVIRKPSNLGFEEAAGIPIAFLTARHALVSIGRLKQKDRILVHAASGGVGMAAIKIARRIGAEIYATASPPKWEALREVGVDRISNSREAGFAERILEQSRGQSMDLVLNSLPLGSVPESLSLLSCKGCFVEIGKRAALDQDAKARLSPDLRYEMFDLADLVRDRPDSLHSSLEEILREIATGSYSMIPYSTFPANDAADAFRVMAKAKHVGKVVIRLDKV